MRLIEVKITNFRGYADEVSVRIDDLTVFVGRNDAGKSTILDALDTFFNEAPINDSDCCQWSGSKEVKIACVFDQLPSQVIVDDSYPTTLAGEYLLRSDGLLELEKVYSCSSSSRGRPNAVRVIANHPAAAGLEDLLSLKINELKQLYQSRGEPGGAHQGVKAQMRAALWASADDLMLAERRVQLAKEGAKELADQIEAYLPVYAVFRSDRASTDQDAEAQDPMKLVIKEVMKARESELAAMVAELEQELRKVAHRTVQKIQEMSPELASELEPTVSHKKWESLFSVSLTADDAVPLNKRGSGTRRMVLLNFFRAQAEMEALSRSNVIYAVEEPETSQHPNHQLILLDAFNEMAQVGKAQVLLTTHTPQLARRVAAESLRFVSCRGRSRTVEQANDPEVVRKIVDTLGVLPSHGVRAFLGVEGRHDIVFLKNISRILSQTAGVTCLESAERQGHLIFVPMGGSNLDQWVARLCGLHVPEFYLVDRDTRPPSTPKYQAFVEQCVARGSTAWVTTPRELENYLHVDAIRHVYAGYESSGDPFEDVPEQCAMLAHRAAPGSAPWDELDGQKRSKKISRAKTRLNGECSAQMSQARLRESDPEGDILRWLTTLTTALRA